MLHRDLTPAAIRAGIKSKEILLAGNGPKKIYGKLSCSSGKRMKKDNRVFFKNEDEAIQHGFRPCGHCMQSSYRFWKKLLRA
jgi:hypothetical protein